MSTQVTRVLAEGSDDGGASKQRLCSAQVASSFSSRWLRHARPFRPLGAVRPSRRRRVAPRRAPFPRGAAPRARRLHLGAQQRLDRPARSAASTAVPRTDRSGHLHGGPVEAPNSDGAAVAFMTPGGQVPTPTSTCLPGSTAHRNTGDMSCNGASSRTRCSRCWNTPGTTSANWIVCSRDDPSHPTQLRVGVSRYDVTIDSSELGPVTLTDAENGAASSSLRTRC